MRIVFTGGGSGGHFYPIVAIAQEINKIVEAERLVDVRMYFLSDSPYDERMLIESGIVFKKTMAGKVRCYFSLLNFFDIFKTLLGFIKAFILIFSIYPDVVFGKGGYASFPTLFAARLLRIPVVIHESDSVPGRVNSWAAKFAVAVGIAHETAGEFFPKEKTALVGNPIREVISHPVKEGAREFLKLEENVPVILIVGGSQGAININNNLVDILPQLVERYQLIHQTGKNNFEDVKLRAQFLLEKSVHRERYKPYPYLNELALRMSAGVAALVISRAGASAISEIAAWGLPSIIIPIADSNGDHQRRNAYNYAASGACVVLEEGNLAPNLLLSEINRLMSNPAILSQMSDGARKFSRPDAAAKLARELLDIALSHENKK